VTAALRLEALTVRYGDFTAVDSLDLSVEPGELFALLGPNGAGKSTTLRVLTGQLRPSGGRAEVLGHDVASSFHAVKPRIAYVPDRDNHFEELSGRDNLRLFAGLYRVDRRRVEECLTAVELDDAAALPVRGYSQGMRRKLLLARALLHRPQLVYLDEPTANLDVHSAALVRRLLTELAQTGTTVLLTTHDMAEVSEICQRAAVICRGRLVALGAPAELQARHTAKVVDAVLADGSERAFSLDVEAERRALADLLALGGIERLKSRERDLEAAFLDIVSGAGG
jgi:ABC-2 type transport system ATP-binding protein